MESKAYHNKNFGLYCTSVIVVMMWADKKVLPEEISLALEQAKESQDFDKKDI